MTNKQITIDVPEGKKPKFTENGIEWVDAEPVRWGPKTGGTYWFVSAQGNPTVTRRGDPTCYGPPDNYDKHKNNYNVFKTEKLAQKVSNLMKRNNAVITACLLVDPDYEPNWEDKEETKYHICFNHKTKEWYYSLNHSHQYTAVVVSTKEKGEQICRLLDSWGIK